MPAAKKSAQVTASELRAIADVLDSLNSVVDGMVIEVRLSGTVTDVDDAILGRITTDRGGFHTFTAVPA